MRKVALLVAIVVAFAAAAYLTPKTADSNCVAPQPIADRGTVVANWLGGLVRKGYTETVDMKDTVLGTMAQIAAWWHTFEKMSATGAATYIAPKVPCNNQQPPNTCNPPPADPPRVDVPPPAGQQPQWDPKSAALIDPKAGGPEVAAAALRAAGFPESEIPLGLAIAKYESGFNPRARNSSDHVGLWQISGPNAATLKLGDRTDPVVNARYAYAIWKGRGGTWSRDWSVYATAKQHVAEYQKFAAAAGTGTPTPDSCSGAVDGNVITWNVLYSNNSHNVTAGMVALSKQAKVINVQEFSRPEFTSQTRAALGSSWSVSHPETNTGIWYRNDQLELVSESVTPWLDCGKESCVVRVEDGSSGTSVGPRYINQATFRDKATGATWTDINSHLMPDSTGKPLRTKYFNEHLARMQKVKDRFLGYGPVVMAADWNADHNELAAALGNATPGGSTGIDNLYVYGGQQPVAQKKLGSYGSDHAARMFTFVGATATTTTDPATPAVGKGRNAAREACKRLGAASVGTYPGHQPTMNLAWDCMVPNYKSAAGKAIGQRIADHLAANRKAYGISYIIWNRQILRNYDKPGIPAGTWAPYFNGQSANPSESHINHVHSSYYSATETGVPA